MRKAEEAEMALQKHAQSELEVVGRGAVERSVRSRLLAAVAPTFLWYISRPYLPMHTRGVS